MQFKISALFVLLLFLSLAAAGCSSLELKPASFGWAVEDVVMVESDGTVKVERYMLTADVSKLYFEETGDSSGIAGNQLRIIRDNAGYYYMTARGFKNVYVFEADDAALSLVNKITVYEEDVLTEPAMNQRAPYIELLDSGKLPVKFNKDGLVKEE